MSDVNVFPTGKPFPSVDRTSTVMLHEQVAAILRRAIADGEARRGEKLPAARDLAAVLDVNTNTVLRAIRLLRDEGLLEAGRGKATTVAGTSEKTALITRIQSLVAFGTEQGYTRDEIAALVISLS